MNRSVTVKFTSSDAKAYVKMLGDLVPVIEYRNGVLERVDVKKSRFIRRFQNSIVRAAKKAGVEWAKGLPTNNEYSKTAKWRKL